MRLPRFYARIPLRTATLPPVTRTSCYVIGHRDALVVDPGSRYPGELERLLRHLFRLRGSGGRVQAVLVTHHHPDHVDGAAAVARALDAPIAGHAETLARLRPSGAGVTLWPVDEGQRLLVEPDLELLCLHTPGHAPGHLCLHDPRRRVLLGGDMVPGRGTTLVAPPDGDMAVYLESLERLAALEIQLLLPAHGPVIEEGTAAIRRLIAHRLEREGRVLRALSSDRDLFSLTAEVYSDVPAWLLPLASRSTLAHLIKLEREGRARRGDGERWRSRDR